MPITRGRLPRFLSYSLMMLATVAATVPATAAETAQPVFRVRSVVAATPAAPETPKGETLSPDVFEQNTWRQIGPGLFRTRETLAVARTNAGSGSARVWHVSNVGYDPNYKGLATYSVPLNNTEEQFMWLVENSFKNQTDLKASAYLKNGYLYIDARSTLWVRGPALPFYDFRRVQH